MAGQDPTNNNPKMLGGINMKASEYNLSKAEFLNIRNLDFDTPGALSKRPGSTQMIGANTSGPITSLHGFVNLSGASTVIAASDTALFYMNGASLNLLDTGWSNGQPPDMLTFVNKEWIANGSKYYGWSGIGATPLPAGLPCARTKLFSHSQQYTDFQGFTLALMGGATSVMGAASYLPRSLFVTYSYVRNDGYIGPADFMRAVNIGAANVNTTAGAEYFSGASRLLGGFTIPAGYGISGVALWVAVDSITNGSTTMNIPGFGNRQIGSLSFVSPLPFAALTQAAGSAFDGASVGSYVNYVVPGLSLRPSADLSRFYLYTIIPGASLILSSVGAAINSNAVLNGGGQTYWATRFEFSANGIGESYPYFNQFTGIATGSKTFTGVPFCWFDTYTPKYIEVNQNSMFYSGFSNKPSEMWFAELGDPENIQPENFFEIRTNDGDRLFGHKAYNNQIIAFKQNSFHKVIGDSPDNFELIELSGEYGCISNASVVEYRERLCWLDQKGIVEFNGASWDVISNPVEEIFRRMNLDAAKEKACGVHHLYRNQIWWGIPIDGAVKNNITVVYDYLVNAWTFFDGFSPASFGFVKASANRPTVWRGDYSGMIYAHGESFLGDNGVAISCIATPHWEKNKENETWIWRRTFLDVATVTGLTGVITGKVFSNYNLGTVQGTFAMYQDAFQSRAEMGVVGKAVTAEFAHYSASLPLLINNYSWAKRFLRNV